MEEQVDGWPVDEFALVWLPQAEAWRQLAAAAGSEQRLQVAHSPGMLAASRRQSESK